MSDWRITNQKKYLNKAELLKCNILHYPNKDHEHCSFCWDKFGKEANMLTEGYCTTDLYHWICETCYNDFKDEFQWTIKDEK